MKPFTMIILGLFLGCGDTEQSATESAIPDTVRTATSEIRQTVSVETLRTVVIDTIRSVHQETLRTLVQDTVRTVVFDTLYRKTSDPTPSIDQGEEPGSSKKKTAIRLDGIITGEISDQSLGIIRGKTAAFTTAHAKDLDSLQAKAIATAFDRPTEDIERFRWGAYPAPDDDPKDGLHFLTAWMANEGKYVIRMDASGSIVEVVEPEAQAPEEE